MGSQRQNLRIRCASHCIVLDHEGGTCQALLEDVSMGGALLKVDEHIPPHLQVGDTCDLVFCYGTDDLSLRHPCRVIRRDSAQMAVSFINI